MTPTVQFSPPTLSPATGDSEHLFRRLASLNGESCDDLAQVGALALIKAVGGYDSSRAIRVRRAVQELGAQLPEARGRLAQQRGHPPTGREFADDLEVTLAQLGAAVAAQVGLARMHVSRLPA